MFIGQIQACSYVTKHADGILLKCFELNKKVTVTKSGLSQYQSPCIQIWKDLVKSMHYITGPDDVTANRI